jgi:hypothetical protein
MEGPGSVILWVLFLLGAYRLTRPRHRPNGSLNRAFDPPWRHLPEERTSGPDPDPGETAADSRPRPRRRISFRR